MVKPSNDVQWTPKMFAKLVERYVFRTKITDDFKKAICAMSEDQFLTQKDGLKLVKLLFDRENEMKEIHGSPEELMNDLFEYQNFPCNAEFLGLTDSLNYHSNVVVFATDEGYRFIPIVDAYINYQRRIIEPQCKFTSLLAQSIGNFIGRYKKDSFDLISYDIFQNLVHYETDIRSNLECDNNFKYETIEDVYSYLSEYYDEEDDVVLLKKLRKLLETENSRRPIAKHPEVYEKVCWNHARFHATIKASFITSNSAKKSFLHGETIYARLFDDQDKLHPYRRFFFAKELENALEMAMKKYQQKSFPKGLFPVETEEERKQGILRVVEWLTYQKVLKILELPTDCVHIVLCKTGKTSRDNQAPMNSPYGTYCVLSKYAFIDIFSQVTVGMQLFRTVNEANAFKVLEWFQNLDIFDASRKYLYLIETWKVDEIIDCAYRDLQQYSTEPLNELLLLHYGKAEALEELLYFSRSFPYQNELKRGYEVCINEQHIKRFSSRNIHSLYESAMLFAFIETNPKYAAFLANQGV